MKKVITRFPPSPTGLFHVGSARTALFNYLYAKKYGGEFLLRFEDTDRERSKKEYEEDILNGLAWLNLTHDNADITHQSERTEVYQKYLKQLIEQGDAYEAEESTAGTGKVIRFKNPNKEITFEDEVRGSVTVDTTDLEDFVIARSIDLPLYHLTVVVDDAETEVTHVIRGEDHISNTPRQILLLEALGFEHPVYAHIPLILGEDRSKLSKRHGATSVNWYKEEGYLPEAFINFLTLLGWHPSEDNREIFTLEELIELFTLSNVQKGGAVFNEEKLQWINKEHLRGLSDDVLLDQIASYHPYDRDAMRKLLPFIRERVTRLKEIQEMVAEGELGYFFEKPTYITEKLIHKNDEASQTADYLEHVIELLKKIPDTHFEVESVKDAVWDYATEIGRGNVLWPMRYALSGKERSPDPFEIAGYLGKEETIERLQNAQYELTQS
jgi:glutamyl-tRNA synthetase